MMGNLKNPCLDNVQLVPRKYELTDETRIVDGNTLYRIRALRDIPRCDVRKGDLGGFVRSEKNLSHEGACWIGDEACVYEKARVSGDALVGNNAHISGRSRVCDRSSVGGDARVSGDAHICGNARISQGARVCEDAEVSGDAEITGKACVSQDATVSEYAFVHGNSRVLGRGIIGGRVRIFDDAIIDGGRYLKIDGEVCICKNAIISGNIRISGDVRISDDAEITEQSHVFFMGPLGPSNHYLTVYRTKGGSSCIMRSYDRGILGVLHEELVDDEDDADNNNYRFLLEMARSTSGEWKQGEYGFMLEMARCRASQWKPS